VKVLIADDDPVTRSILRANLEAWEHEVVDVSDGITAWEHLSDREAAPSVAILDWEMPGLSGPDICYNLRCNDKIHYIYVLLLTHRDSKRDLDMAFDAGADDFMVKPIDPEVLHSRLNAGRKVINYEQELKAREFMVRLDCYNALTELAETRDNETGRHIKRLGTYSTLLATVMELDDKFVHDIGLFAPMHDIGKVGIPDSILLKRGKLSKGEFDTMKDHTTLGYSILKARSTLDMASEIALYHHEKFDGSGYPHGLAGESIPLEARIVAVADVYDSLRSVRVYKEAWSHDKACALIRDEAGKHFDPRIVEAFLSVHEDMNAIFNELSGTDDETPSSMVEESEYYI